MQLTDIQDLIVKGKLDVALLEIGKLKGIQQFYGSLLNCKIFERMGKYEESLVLATKTVEEGRKNGDFSLELSARIAQSYALISVNKFDEALNIIEIGENLLQKSISNDQISLDNFDANFKNLKGLTLRYQGKLKDALKNYEASLNIRKNLKIRREEAMTLQNIATVYQLQGELIKSLEYNLLALKIFEEFDDQRSLAYTYHDIGLIHWTNGELEIALDFLKNSLSIRQEIGDLFTIIDTLYYLIQINLEMDNKTNAIQYQEKLEEYYQKAHNKRSTIRHQLAKALILKSNDRIIQTAEAQQIFLKLSQDPNVDHEFVIFAMLNLCELLISELKAYKNENILSEVLELSNKLLNIAKVQDLHSLLAHTYILQSRLALLELDVTKAQYLLTKAELTANKKNMENLAMKISDEYDAIIDRRKWEKLKSSKAPLVERVEKSQLDEILAEMIKKHKEEKFESIDEIPILLLILNQSGITIYSKRFDFETQVSEQLIGGFLTASSAGMTQALSGQGSIERIKYGDHVMIFKNTAKLTFCYVFQGKSYLAIQHLNKFIEQISLSNTRWKTINAKVPKPKLIENLLKEFVHDNFPIS